MIPLIIAGFAAAGGLIGAGVGKCFEEYEEEIANKDKMLQTRFQIGYDEGRKFEKNDVGAIRSGNVGQNRVDDIL